MPRRRMVQVIPGFPIYARARRGYYPKPDSQSDTSEATEQISIGTWVGFFSIPVVVLSSVIAVLVIALNNMARERGAIRAFDKMSAPAQSEILQRRAIELSCITSYRHYTDNDGDPRSEAQSATYYYDSLDDFRADRQNPNCTVVTNNFPNGTLHLIRLPRGRGTKPAPNEPTG